jgi:long-chain fatty acid transport protein
MRQHLIKILLRISFFTVFCYHITGYGGGFQLFEQSVTYLGNAFAGTGAGALDASTAFYNPAGLTLLPYPEFQSAVSTLDVKIRADVKSSTSNSLVGSLFEVPPTPVMGTTRTHAGAWNYIPALNLALPVCRCVAFGLSVTAPFGLNTDWAADSQIKYIATSSKLVTLDVSPEIAFQVTPQFSIGGGVDVEYAKVVLNTKVPVGEDLPPVPFGGPFPDGQFENTARDEGYGWNLGALYNLNCGTRLGASYRSRIHHRLKGDATIDLPSPLHTQPGDIRLNLTLPDSLNVSAYHDFNRHWAGLASINYTHWSVINVVTVHYTGLITQSLENASLGINFKDTCRYSLGTNFSPNECFKLKGGVAYDPSPVKSSHTRTYRIPDVDRYWVSVGAQYKISRCLVLDAGYSHFFVPSSRITQTQKTNLSDGATLVASARSHLDLGLDEFGLQLTWIFV